MYQEGVRQKLGLEVEFFVIDQEGRLHSASPLIKECRKVMGNNVRYECGQEMIEFGGYPKIKTRNVVIAFLENILKAVRIAERLGLGLCYLSTYPGRWETHLTRQAKYLVKEKIIGPKRFRYARSVIGFHCHFEIPKETFDKKTRWLKEDLHHPRVKTLIDEYNLMTAADPALGAMLQSSPYFDLRYRGKDGRVSLYRDKVYGALPLFGTLLPYMEDYAELCRIHKEKAERWIKLLRSAGASEAMVEKTPKLTYAWNPIKINPLGTLEERGMDSNNLVNLMGAVVLIKSTLRDVYDGLKVKIDKMGIKHPFRYKDDCVFVPPFDHVIKIQKLAAKEGFDNEQVWMYANNFLELGKMCMKKKYMPIVRPIDRLVKERETVSDKVIRFFRKKGYGEMIDQEVACEAALKFSINEEEICGLSQRLESILSW
jgi:carboxylate-amine ligase